MGNPGSSYSRYRPTQYEPTSRATARVRVAAVALHSSVSKGRMNWSIVEDAVSRGSRNRKLRID